MAVCTDRHRAGEVHFCKKCDENNSTMDYINDEVSKQAGTITFLRAELEKARLHKDAAENQVAMLCGKIDAEQVVFDDMKARAEKAEAAIDAVLNLYPNLENYIDSARRDAKEEEK